MKSIIHSTLICIVSTVAFSCSSSKSTTTSGTTTTTPATTTTGSNTVTTPVQVAGQPVPVKKDGTVRFFVSFYSKGEGSDYKIKDEFVAFLNGYPKKIAYQPTTWGREGETDFCLALTELSAAEQAEFIKKANDILSKSRLVNKKENSDCDHNNWPATTSSTEDMYRLVVSFYSKGEGSDYKMKEEFEKFLNNYSKKIAFEPTSWGREGETDYCLKLNELTTAEQAELVRKAKEMLSKSALVHVNENTKCVHKH